MAAIFALSSVACNSASVDENTKNNEDVIISNVAEDNVQASESLAKDLLLINSNGIIEESKRAAAELGIYMPDPQMNGAPAGTYPIQGFLLSASSPADTFGNGMSIIYRLSDGSLFVFDGGSGNVKYMLYKCLKDLSGGGKIKIAAWVMTHSHWDHYGAMYDLLNGIYKYDFEIQEFWFNRANNTADATGSGGFIGTMIGGGLTVQTCHNIGDVQNNGPTGHTGGLIGRLSGVLKVDIDGFKNLRAVYNTSNFWEGVGGVIGIMGDVSKTSTGTYTFKNCMNCGWVRGSMAGGIVGLEQSSHGIDIRFERCLNTSQITTLGYGYSGGILGRSNGELRGLTFSQCMNVGEITANTSDSWGVGGICGNIGEDGHTYNFSSTFENCVNGGAINCKSSSNTTNAAGILSRNNYTTTTIKNCINLGTLTHASYPSNIVPITAKCGSVTYNVSGCSYLSSKGNPVFGETAKSVTEIRTDVARALTVGLKSESEYYNYRNSDTDINSVGEGVDRILSATSVADIKQGCLAIYDHVASLVLISDKKTELLELLGEKIYNDDGDYTLDSYEAYSDAYLSIKSIIENAKDMSVLEVIDVEVLKDAAEAKLVKDTAPDPDAPSLDIDISGESNVPTETESESETLPTKGKKCGASISISVIALTCVLGTALVVKKKD